MSRNGSGLVRLSGLVIAGIGLAHFAKPEAFESVTSSAFRENVRQHIYINGGIETALGLGLAAPKTRRLASIGVIGYLAYLAANVIRNA